MRSLENTTLKKTENTSTEMGINYELAELIKSVLGINDTHLANIIILNKNLFMLSQEDVIDKFKLQLILKKGYSRIPVYANKDKNDIKGKFLEILYLGLRRIKNLIGLDFQNKLGSS